MRPSPAFTFICIATLALLRERILTAFAEPLGPMTARLSRTFKRVYGCTPTEMLREERIAQAAALIRGRRHSLKDIAGRCGFYDHSHFSNVFRRVMGMTPRQYALSTAPAVPGASMAMDR